MRASSVLPTPVGPRNRNEPIGRLGSESPARERRIALATAIDRVVLADDPLVEHVLHADELRHLAFHEPAHGDAGPLGDDLGDVLLVDLLLEHLVLGLEVVEARGLHLDLGVELAHRAVAQLRGLLEVALALGLLRVHARLLEPLLQLADLGDGVLLVLPVRDHRVALLGERRELALDRLEAVLRRLVGLLRQRRLLDLELADAPLDDVDLERHGVDLDPEPRRGLVDRGRWPCRGAGAR